MDDIDSCAYYTVSLAVLPVIGPYQQFGESTESCTSEIHEKYISLFRNSKMLRLQVGRTKHIFGPSRQVTYFCMIGIEYVHISRRCLANGNEHLTFGAVYFKVEVGSPDDGASR